MLAYFSPLLLVRSSHLFTSSFLSVRAMIPDFSQVVYVCDDASTGYVNMAIASVAGGDELRFPRGFRLRSTISGTTRVETPGVLRLFPRFGDDIGN